MMDVILTKYILQIFNFPEFLYFMSVVLFSGIVANGINISVFAKMDLQDSTNISLLALSISDFLVLVLSLLIYLTCYPELQDVDLVFSVTHIGVFILARPYYCFKRISNLIMAFITCERCLCIIQPIKVRDIITPRRSIVILVAIGVTMAITTTPLYMASFYKFALNSVKNKTSLALFYTYCILEMESLATSISFTLAMLTLAWVVACTVILVSGLKRNSVWRAQASDTLTTSKIYIRDKKVIKMVSILLIIFIAAFYPECAVLIAQAIEPELSLSGKYRNLHVLLLRVTETMICVSMSVNIIIYLKMSSKYRQAFKLCFCKANGFCLKYTCSSASSGI